MKKMSIIKGRNILNLAEFSGEEIIKILDLADKFKDERKRNIFNKILKNKTLAMIFQKPSTRTRISFDVAMMDLGGNTIPLSSTEIQLSRGETIRDTAKSLSCYVDAVMARVYNHSEVYELAKYASIPIINGLSELYHPTQVLADLQTIREKKGRLKGLKLAWIGDGNNICNTLLIGCSRTGINMSVASPTNYKPNMDAYNLAKKEFEKNGNKVEIIEDVETALNEADIVVTDTFISMGSDAQRDERLKTFLPKYQVNKNLIDKAKPNAIFLHCLPAHRGEEVTTDVIDGPTSFSKPVLFVEIGSSEEQWKDNVAIKT
ncbi:ornithine carbamoyltransferase, partial [Thermoproteota archaeon]